MVGDHMGILGAVVFAAAFAAPQRRRGTAPPRPALFFASGSGAPEPQGSPRRAENPVGRQSPLGTAGRETVQPRPDPPTRTTSVGR